MVKVGYASTHSLDIDSNPVHRYATPSSTRSGRQAIIAEGYKFHLHRRSAKHSFWRCRADKACKCYVKTNNESLVILSTTGCHNHELPAKTQPAATLSVSTTPVSDETTTQVFSVSSNSKWSIYESRREKTCLRVDNFSYYIRKEHDGLIRWRCSYKNCKAVMESDRLLQHRRIIKHLHTHPPRSDEFFLSQQLRHRIKRRLSNDPSEQIQKTIDLVTKDVPVECLNPQLIKRFRLTAKKKKRSNVKF